MSECKEYILYETDLNSENFKRVYWMNKTIDDFVSFWSKGSWVS